MAQKMWIIIIPIYITILIVCAHGKDLYDETAALNGQFVTNDQLLSALSFAEDSLNKLKRLETAICNSRINITQESLSFGQLLESLPNEESKELDRIAQIILKASVQILNRHCVSKGIEAKQCAAQIAEIPIPPSPILDKCREIAHLTAGLNTYRRLLPAAYKDGLYKIPQSSNLPLPKDISDSLFASNYRDAISHNDDRYAEGFTDTTKNVALVQWAQFIEHDLVKTVARTMSNNVPIECCSQDLSNAPPRYLHPACAPLQVQSNLNHVACLNYVRSALGVNKYCKFGQAEQLNQATNKLDLSQLYGTTDIVTTSLRKFKKGELKSSCDSSHPCLPRAHSSDNLCMHLQNSTRNTVCYKSGDSRVNIDPYATTIYTLFLRSHNRIAKRLKQLRSSWNDERIFKLARKINIAIYNKIVLGEWSEVVLGKEMSDKIKLQQAHTSHIRQVSNEFATVAARFYYSMMPGDLVLTREYSGHHSKATNIITRLSPVSEVMTIKNEFYKPRNLGSNNELDAIIHAILHQSAMAMDSGYVDDITKYRFQYSESLNIGTDVLALDILRARDHGLQNYVKYLQLCTNYTVNAWEELELYMSTKNIDRLKLVYPNVESIDLIVGAISETPRLGATVGPTLICIIGEQLMAVKRGADLDFNKNDNFLSTLLNEYTGSRFICENTNLQFVPRNIFYKPSVTNPLVDCDELNGITDYHLDIIEF